MTRLLAKMEVDRRLVGLAVVLLVIWIGFDIASGGRFITPRNIFNLSVQTASVAVMACGMVLIIVTRHIDLSVGAMLGVLAMIMGVVQTDFLPQFLEYNHPMTWIITLLVGLVVGAAIGGVQGLAVGYLGVPAFIVTLGGLLVWRGAAWWVTQGRTVAPLDHNFMLLGGGIEGTIGATWSWIVAAIAIVAIIYAAIMERRRRLSFQFPVKPIWAEYTNTLIKAGLVLVAIITLNAYHLPERAAERILEDRGIPVTAENLVISHGIPIPLLIVALVAIVLTIVAKRTRFGRYVFAMGGNPQAAELAGINVKRMTVAVFALMGVLCAISAAISSARLQSAGNDLGTLDELRVIAAVVIGGTSLAGGVGTIYGALIGALVMQSLQSGMALLGVDTSLQSIVIGLVLVLAVFSDKYFHRRYSDPTS
ncbi:MULTISPECIES: sugar ABC transporter permease [Thalassospira]|jgi:D-xylose transport system permease protein|uniref:sugar ABC transporter permease n=1 Tax=Thalassospira TaxID=168934 RepID=UPI001FFFEAF4|nr:MULTISPECIES: sugar ABC transporter permease [Thalassospira]MCK2169150.1 sugar ABC transporter permease [Thalassospira xiamenensis]WOI11224.1 sugar ABC transporter permease [Thalassospira lucentensis]